MSSQLIIDNWLLQDIGACLSNGLSDDFADEIIINKASDNHECKSIPESGVQIEALFSLLIDIVYRDTLIVDANFTNTWEEHQNYFFQLKNSSLLREINFREQESKLSEPRKLIVEKLCTTTTLKKIQKLNEESWVQKQGMYDPYMSAVIWGTAGMLSRSHIFEAPYSGHPLRRRIIEQSLWNTSQEDVTNHVLSWINTERFKFYEYDFKNKQASIILPPIIVEIIEEANDIDELIPVACDIREKYKKVREWLKEIHSAIENEDVKKIAKFKKVLNSISNDVNKLIGNNDYGNISLGVGLDGLTARVSSAAINNITKRFGVRPLLSQQIFSKKGKKSLKKLFRLFNEINSTLALEIEQYLAIRRF